MDFREMVYQQRFAEAEKDMSVNGVKSSKQRSVLRNLTEFLSGFMRTTSTEPSAMNGF